MLGNIRTKELGERLGVHHPLFDKINTEIKIIRYIHALFQLEYDLSKSVHKIEGLDEDCIMIFSALKGWYKIVLSLSGAFSRNCGICGRCVADSVREGAIVPGARAIRKVIENPYFGKLPVLFSETILNISNLANAFEHFCDSMHEPLETVNNLLERQAVLVERVLPVEIKGEQGHEEFRALWRWFERHIKVGVREIKQYIKAVQAVINDTGEITSKSDSKEMTAWGADILKAITIEEVYDKRDAGLNNLISLLYLERDTGGFKQVKSIRSNLNANSNEIRAALPLQGRMKPEMIQSIYERQYAEGNFMAMPNPLKENIFRSIIGGLQTRLSIRSAAKLMDAYLGNAAFPYMEAMSLLWLPVLVGYLLAIATDYLPLFIMTAGATFVLYGLYLLVSRFYSGSKLHHRKRQSNIWKLEMELGQFMPEFLVPMIISLTPFVLTDELRAFVRVTCQKTQLYALSVFLFLVFSMFAIWKLQGEKEANSIKNSFYVLGMLWPQAFFCSLFMLVLFRSGPELEAGTSLWFIVDLPARIELFTFWGTSWFAYPSATLLFSVLCLFVAVFLEGLYRKHG